MGDVILVQDETVMEDDLKLVGLETLVCAIAFILIGTRCGLGFIFYLN